MSYFVYVLLSEDDGSYYIGSSRDVSLRLQQHNQGRCRYTKGHRPWKLVHHELFKSHTEALIRERFLKTGAGRNTLKNLLSD